jgi:hypothetical protein
MQTSALVLEDRFKVDYDLCKMGYFYDDEEEESPTCFWDFDAEVLHDTLSRTSPTVVRLQPEDGGHFVGLCELLEASHDFWIATWFYGRKFDNRGLTLHGDCRGWLVANDAYALLDSQAKALSNIWSGTRAAEKVKEVFNSEGQLCRIQYDQRIGREHWFWNFDEDLRGQTMLHHFCVERIKDFRTRERIASGGYRIAFVTGNADDHCRSMRDCYAKENSL